MVQKSGDHHLRLVVEIPLFTGFYAFQLVQDFFLINCIPASKSMSEFLEDFWDSKQKEVIVPSIAECRGIC